MRVEEVGQVLAADDLQAVGQLGPLDAPVFQVLADYICGDLGGDQVGYVGIKGWAGLPS